MSILFTLTPLPHLHGSWTEQDRQGEQQETYCAMALSGCLNLLWLFHRLLDKIRTKLWECPRWAWPRHVYRVRVRKSFRAQTMIKLPFSLEPIVPNPTISGVNLHNVPMRGAPNIHFFDNQGRHLELFI